MTKSSIPKKQRKAIYDAAIHTRRKLMSSHLSPELRSKYNLRSLPIRKGDIVRVMRGNRGDAGIRGKEGRITDVYRRDLRVAVEGITRAKADNKQVAVKIHPSKVMIIKLDLTDAKRRSKVEAAMKPTQSTEVSE